MICKDWDIVRGDDFSMRVAVTAGGVAVPLTGWSFSWQVRVDPDAPATLAAATFDTSQLANGFADGLLAGVDTAKFPSIVHYDIQVITNAGRKKTYMIGKLNVRRDSTRP